MPLDDIPPQAGQVLFVDDDAFYRDLATDALAGAGYAVQAASGGAEAVAQLSGRRFDLLVLDLGMPGVSGFDVLAHIRSTPKLLDLPVLVITGHDDAESVSRAFDLGATSFLAKPLNWMLFVHHVQFVLKAARTQTDLRQANRTAEFMSDLKSRLVGTLVTEFQSPLRAALGFSRLLKEETDGPIASAHYRAWITDLHTSLEKLGATHVKMLNFGRTLADSIAVTDETLEMKPFVTGVLQGAATAAARRQIAIELTDRTPPVLELRGDSVFLTQALRGVLENAIRFSRRRTTIRVSMRQDQSGDVAITVEDTSRPLTAAQIDVIQGVRSFGSPQPESVEMTTGLKLSRILVEAHQGRLHLIPGETEGMRSELLLPAARVVSLASTADETAARLREASARLQAAMRSSSADDGAPRPAVAGHR